MMYNKSNVINLISMIGKKKSFNLAISSQQNSSLSYAGAPPKNAHPLCNMRKSPSLSI
jgi:hypothetical protein